MLPQERHAQALAQGRCCGQKAHHLVGQRIEAIHVHIFFPQKAAVLQPSRHIAKLILAVAEPCPKHFFILGVDQRQIAQLFPGDSRGQLFCIFCQHIRRHATPLQIGDQRRCFFHKAGAQAHGPIVAQLIFQPFQRKAHRHPPPGAVQRFPLIPPAAFQHPFIKPGRT